MHQSKAAEIYNRCAAIDKNNRDRKDALMIERKLKTHDLSPRVNLFLFVVNVVDSWKVYSNITFTTEENSGEAQKELYAHLAAEMIDKFDSVSMSERRFTLNESDSTVLCQKLVNQDVGYQPISLPQRERNIQ
jgi:hypothetical protein